MSAAVADDPLREEYYFLQGIVGGFNADCLEIKKWSVTTASIVAIVGQLGLKQLEPVLITIAVLALCFWLTETVWRINQWAFLQRVREMEVPNDAPKISTSWMRLYYGAANADAKKSRWGLRDGELGAGTLLGHFFAPITLLPHAIILVVASGLALALADRPPPPPDPQHIDGDLTLRLQPGAAVPATLGAVIGK